MSRTLNITESLLAYVQRVGTREPPALTRCRELTQAMSTAAMQIGPEQGAFMQTVVAAIGAKRALEVGVFTGYSSTAVALTMKELHGKAAKLIACDVSEEYTAKARATWREAGVDDIVELRLGPAVGTLEALVAQGQAGSFDLAFIDADKTSYRAYYELVLTLLRHGGTLLIDNMLWGGAVADASNRDPDTVALRELGAFIHDDPRVVMTLATIGDGLSVVVKR